MHTLTRLGSVCTCTGACHRFQGHLEGHARAHGALCPPTRKVWARSAGCHWASRGTDERCPDVVHKSVVQLTSVSDHFFYREKAGGRLCCQASMSHKHEEVWEDLGPEWVRLKRLGGGAHG
jgi:hypothetical protein